MDTAPVIRMQIKIHAPVEKVYTALTSNSALTTWLAESADVDIATGRLLFWGKYTPDNPSKESQHLKLIDHKPNRLLKFSWHISDSDTTVTIKLRSRHANTTILTLVHENAGVLHHQDDTYTLEDFWFLHMENLRRYVDGKPSEARIDFSQPMNGNIRHILDSDATPEQIYEVLTNPELIEKWIASKATIDPQKGGDLDLGWGVGPSKILELKQGEEVQITWRESDDSWQTTFPTTVTWTLDASSGKTRITFTHSGFDDDRRNAGIWAGWMNFLNWIRSVAEYGSQWEPPMIPLKDNDWAQIYPKSMHEIQHELVSFE